MAVGSVEPVEVWLFASIWEVNIPTVPYKPVPSASAEMIPTPGARIDSPIAAFGGTIAKAVEGVGGELDKVGNEIWHRAVALQELRNEAEAREQTANYIIEVGKRHAEFSALEGKAAVDAAGPYYEGLKDLRDQMKGQLKNPDSQRRFESEATSTMARTIFNGAGHAATENKRYLLGTNKARVDSVYDESAQNPATAIPGARQKLKELNDDDAALHGWSDEQREDELRKKESGLVLHRIVSMASNHPFEAQKLFEENKTLLRGNDLFNAEKTVDTYVRSAGSRIIAERLVKPPEEGKFEEPLSDSLRKGAEEAEKLRPGDSLLKQEVERSITSRHSMLNGAKREFDYENKSIIDGAVVGNYGKRPTTTAELLASDPAVARAWGHMTDSQKKPFYSALMNNAKIPDIERRAYENSQEGLDRYNEIRGMAQSNPKGFLELNISDERFTPTMQRRLSDLQRKISTNADQDPRVTHALSVIRQGRGPIMESLGIFRRTEANKEDYDRFVGALQNSLEIYQQDNKKPPDAKQTLEMADKLMYQKPVPRFLDSIFGPGKAEPVYNISVPDDVSKQIKEEIKTRGGVEPTDEAIRREYVKLQLKRLYRNVKPSNE